MKKLESDLKQDLVYNIVGSDIRKLRRLYKMHPTLKEVLQLSCLKNAKIITRNCDMSRKVEYVDVAEVPDVFIWIRPNTFILTAVYALKDDVEAQVKLISKLSELKATALSIKPQRFIGKIPDPVIEEANKLNFPLIELPNDVLYSEVILGISKLIFDKKEKGLQKSLDMNNAFTKLLLEGGSFVEIAEKLSDMTKNPILIEDMDFNILAYADTTKDLQVKNNLYANILSSKERHNLALKNRNSKNPILYKINKDWVYALLPINIGEEILGFITMLKGSRNNTINSTAMKHASVVTALELNRIKSFSDKELLMKKQLIDSLLYSDIDSNKSLSSQIIHFGWSINQHYLAVAIRPKIDEKSSLELIECEHVYFKRLMQVLGTNFYTDYPKVINHLDGKNILFFIGLSDEEAKDYKKYITSFID
ncbi:MAG: PucR family transcriptional regulator ligand-binding domain-containing protein, partial [Bacteroidales bacterium]|nr:PucR family transcriptional regulator ligand-binding domain-containing protein [Bacteroidales bacterium]